jgi:hypothetical protein
MEQIWKKPETPYPIRDLGRCAFLVHLQTGAPISGSSGVTAVEVRVLSTAPYKQAQPFRKSGGFIFL